MIFSSVPSPVLGRSEVRNGAQQREGRERPGAIHGFPFQAWVGRAGQKAARAPGHRFSSNSSGVLVFRDLPQWPPLRLRNHSTKLHNFPGLFLSKAQRDWVICPGHQRATERDCHLPQPHFPPMEPGLPGQRPGGSRQRGREA